MRIVLSSLVTCSLLLHAVMGCCWHHAQESLCSCDDPPVAEAVDCCDHQHGDHGDGKHGQPSPAPCDGQQHCQGVCTYLPVQKTQLDTQQLDMPMDFAAIVPATFDAQVAFVSSVVRTHETAAEPPLRLHLFYQILLI